MKTHTELLIDVIDAEYAGDYCIRLIFDDGAKKIVDLKKHLKGEIFEPLKDEDFFKSFKVNRDTGTIEWPNEADFCPDFLYRIGKDVK